MQSLLKHLKTTTLLFLTMSAVALPAWALDVLKISTGQYVAVEANIVNPAKPAFVFLPGVFRGLDLRDSFIQTAKKQKLNFISIHSSLHPESVKEIPKNETPYFKFKKVTSADLAKEVEAVIAYYELKNAIPVGLSYSSTISSALAATGRYPVVIETAPMIRFDESDPSGSQVTQFWKNYFDLFPVYGGFWKDAYLKQTYEYYWSKEIDSLLKRYPEYVGLRQNLISSYAALSIAADGFDFSKQKFSPDVQRIFILGENEEARRYELQLKAIEIYEAQSGYGESTTIIPRAGHIIPTEAPGEYIKILKAIIAP